MPMATRRSLGAGLAAMLAAAPAAARAFDFGAPDTIRITLPGLRHIVCAATVRGVRTSAIIDSGAAQTVVSQELADRIGLRRTGGRQTWGLTGASASEITEGLEIWLGDRRLQAPQPRCMDLGFVGTAQPLALGLIIGRELFESFTVVFDFQALGMRLADRQSGPAGSGWRRLALETTAQGRLTAQVDLETTPVSAEIDLGSDVPVYLSEEAARRTGLDRDRPSSQAASFGVEGMSLDRVFTLRSMELGGALLRQVPARCPADWRADVPAILGLPVLRRFDLAFRTAASELWVRPTDARRVAFRKDRSGVGAAWSAGRLQIAFVAPGSPAEAAGLAAGDVVVEVDGRKVDAAYASEGARAGSGVAGSTLHLRLADGRRVSLVLRDYY